MPGIYTRRSFLRLCSLGGSCALLAACQPKAVEVTRVVEQVVKETVVVKEAVEVEKEVTRVVERTVAGEPAAPKKKMVRIIMSSWAVGEIPFDMAAREFSEANEGVQVEIQTAAEGWDTKVIAQIAEGNLQWSAAGIASSASSSLPKWFFSNMIQPMDPYLEVSSQQGADQVLPDMIPTLREASTHEGEFLGIPYSFENICFAWRTDYFAEVGRTERPMIWDDWYATAVDLKKWGGGQKIYPTSFIPDLDASVGALIYSALEEPFGDDDLLRWDTPEAKEALEFYRQMVWEELTPPHGFDGWLDAYYAGKVASVMAQSSRGVWGQRAFGTETVRTSPIPTYEPGSGAGTPYWGNCTCILNKAPYPQEATDFLVYMMGPQNIDFHRLVVQTGKTPVYNSIYETIIKSDPQFRTFSWMLDMREQVERSRMRPFNNYFSIQDSYYQKHIVAFTEPGSPMTVEEFVHLILEETREEIAKQRL